MRRIYGTWVDPDKDCKYELANDKLRVKIPAAQHTLEPRFEKMNAPRIWQEVEGDFDVTVRVTFPIRPAPAPQADGPAVGYAAAGLIAWSSKANSIRLRRSEFGRQNPKEVLELAAVSPSGQEESSKHDTPASESVYFRLTRNGRHLSPSQSRDGKKWLKYITWDVDEWGEKIMVGVVAENAYKAPFEATFDQYSLTRPKK